MGTVGSYLSSNQSNNHHLQLTQYPYTPTQYIPPSPPSQQKIAETTTLIDYTYDYYKNRLFLLEEDVFVMSRIFMTDHQLTKILKFIYDNCYNEKTRDVYNLFNNESFSSDLFKISKQFPNEVVILAKQQSNFISFCEKMDEITKFNMNKDCFSFRLRYTTDIALVIQNENSTSIEMREMKEIKSQPHLSLSLSNNSGNGNGNGNNNNFNPNESIWWLIDPMYYFAYETHQTAIIKDMQTNFYTKPLNSYSIEIKNLNEDSISLQLAMYAVLNQSKIFEKSQKTENDINLLCKAIKRLKESEEIVTNRI